MSQTPYAPPTARVSEPPEVLHPKPTSVRRAVVCLWISVALTAALTAFQLVGVVATAEIVQIAVTGVVTAGLLALIAAKLAAGRGWARWLFMALYVFGSLMFVISVLLVPQVFLSTPALLQASAVVQFALQTAALVLMFTHASRQWFKAPHAESVPSAL